MFQPLHLLVLALTAALIPPVCMTARTLSPDALHRRLRLCAVAALLFDPAYWLWEWCTSGKIDAATSLPLYLCSLFWLLLPAAVFSRREPVRRIASATVCTVGLLGGVMGLVFNVYVGQYAFFSFVPVRSLLYHILMILTAAAMWAGGYYSPRPADRLLCFLPVAALVAISLLLNHRFGWDYCYTAGGIGTPLERLSAVLPRGLFLLVLYGTLLLLIQVLFYHRRRSEAQPAAICFPVAE